MYQSAVGVQRALLRGFMADKGMAGAEQKLSPDCKLVLCYFPEEVSYPEKTEG